MFHTPELLAPAGSLDKLKTAILYGADAVYFGGQQYGLRAAADNLTPAEIREALQFAHGQRAQAYVVLNGFLHDTDLLKLPEFVEFLAEVKVDAAIISDPGVARLVARHSKIPIHVSTQASVLNSSAVRFWQDLGATRVVVGRELTVEEAAKIKQETGIEVEMFIHGAQCMSYSGHCVISNYTQGRDSNRGGCAHSCRFNYELDFSNASEEKKRAYFLSSTDLEGLRAIELMAQAGIDSLKIEGRMKGPLYAGTITKVYREALDYYKAHGNLLSNDIPRWEEEIRRVPHRRPTSGNLLEHAGAESIHDEREGESGSDWDLAAVVLETHPESGALVEVRNAFHAGDTLQWLPFKGEVQAIQLQSIIGLDQSHIQRTKPGTLAWLPDLKATESMTLLRRQRPATVAGQ